MICSLQAADPGKLEKQCQSELEDLRGRRRQWYKSERREEYKGRGRPMSLSSRQTGSI